MNFRFGKSLKNDFLLFLWFISFIIGIGFMLFVSVGPDSYRMIDWSLLLANGVSRFDLAESALAIVFSLISLTAFVLFFKRLAYITSFQKECEMVSAKVVDIHYVKDRCGIDLEYLYEGEKRTRHIVLMNNAQTKYIHMDSEVSLLVKNRNPKKVLIPSLYFDE